MPSIHHVLLASALIGASAAIPVKTNHLTSVSSFKVDLVPKNHSRVKNGAAAYAHVLKKYGGSSETITNKLAAADVTASSVVATPNDNDLEYTAPVMIGDQTFQLDFDTGSSDLWVLGSSLSSQGDSGHTYYEPSSSATLENGESWKISYGDGSSASGTVYSDTVTVGETTVTKQAVESATQASSAFTSASAEDGLLGLGFDTINTVTPTPAKTFFSTAIGQGLPQSLFTALLKKGAAGSYTFGEIDSSQYTGDITYTDVDSSQGFWMFSPSGYSVGSTAGSASSSALTGIADTGTTLMLVEDSVLEAYYAQVSGAKSSTTYGGYVFSCDADLPDFTLNIGDYDAVVPGSYINYSANGDGTCFGGIQSSESVGFAIYGDIFLKSQFVVFDQTQSTPRLGFAAQAS